MKLKLLLRTFLLSFFLSLIGLNAQTINVGPGETYTTIQSAINAASGGELINVAAGTYTEQLTIVDKSLEIVGAGEGLTIIQPPNYRTGTVTEGSDVWDYILAAYTTSGTKVVRISGVTLDANSETRKAAKFAGAFFRDIVGGGGIVSSTIEGFEQVEYESWGVVIYGASSLIIQDNTLKEYTRDGILVNGDGGANTDPVVWISDNDLTGSALPLNGISIGKGATGEIGDNVVRDHYRSAPWAAVGIMVNESDGIDVTENNVTNSHYGIDLLKSNSSRVADNTISAISHNVLIDDSDNNEIFSNTITGVAGVNVGILLTNGSTGNVIGGDNPLYDGNEITFPTTGSLLYCIYVPGTVGSGSNTIKNNTITGGTRAVQIDGGNSGTTTVSYNTIDSPSFAGIYFNAGTGVVSNNALTNSVRPIEFWGATDITIDNNTIDGSTFDAMNCGSLSGALEITNNEIFNIPAGQYGVHCRPDADGALIDNNEIYNSDRGINVESGCTGVTITDNNIHDNNFSGIELHNVVTELSGNTLSANKRGIETWVALIANNNNILSHAYGGIILHDAGPHDATLNWWGDVSGPSGTGYPGTGTLINDNGNTIDYSPWLGATTGTDPMPLGTDEDIQDAIDAAAEGATINVTPGTYNHIDITTNGLTLNGNGAIVTNASPAITISANNVTVDGFVFNFDASDWAIYVSGDYSGNIVKNCTFNNVDGVSVGNGIDNNTNNSSGYYLDATVGNDWGDSSGPTHASANPTGTGVNISNYVIFEWDGLTAPIHSVSGISVTPTFEWGAVGTWPQPNYNLVVSENSDLSSPIYDKDLGTATTVTIADTAANFPLDNNSQYYWSLDILDGSSTAILQPDTNYFYTVDDITIGIGHPADEAELYVFDPLQFSWYLSQAQGSIKFMLQIKDTSAAPGALGWLNYADVEYDNIGSIYKSVNGLTGGTRYYWRLVAYYDDGVGSSGSFDWLDRVVKISGEYYFDTKGGAVTAYPSWPVGGNTIYSLTPTFYWYTLQYESSVTFEVLYSTSSASTGGILDSYTTLTAGSNTWVTVGTDLDPSQDYYWQVKTIYGSEVKYSSIAEFTTYDAPGIVATPATLSYPVGGIEIYTQSPTFYWYIEGYNVSVDFTVELTIDGTWGNGDDITFGTTTDTYIQGSGLAAGTTYTWRVKADDGTNVVYSTTNETFSVVGGASSSIVLSWPTGNPTMYSATPTLSWYLDGSSIGWDNYVVRWNEGTSPASWGDGGDWDDEYETSDMNETWYTFTSDLNYGTTYFWAVALDDGSALADGDFVESSFTIAGGSAVPVVLTAPANNSTGITKKPSFYWYVDGSTLGIDKYKVEYSKTELFTDFVNELESATTYATVSVDLEAGTTYWWRVYTSFDNGSSWNLASPTWKFTIEAGASAVMPLVGSPANGVTININAPMLSWYLPTQSTSTLSYEVEVANNSDFVDASVYQNIPAMNAQLSTLEDGEYYWRVKSNNGNSASSYSNVGKFRVGESVTAVEDEEIPVTYSIEQNYPNPFNPTTTINYSIPELSFVTIRIYNTLGQEVKTLVNKEVEPGKLCVIWRGDNNYGQQVSSGTYIYRITAGDFVQAKKMILLK